MTKMFDRLTRPFFFTGCIAAATAAFAVASFSATEAVATQTASTGVASEAPKELAWLALSETQAKRLGGDRVRLQAPDPTRRTFVIDKQGQAASFVALSFTSTKQHRVDCSLAEGTAALVEDRTLEGGTRTIGAAAAVQQCKSLAAGISALGSDGWRPGADVHDLPLANGPDVTRDVKCEEKDGKCKCKCEHGWNPFGGAFCVGFMLVGDYFQDCNWGTFTCGAPASACD